MYDEQYCINEISHAITRSQSQAQTRTKILNENQSHHNNVNSSPLFIVHSLPPLLFPDGRSYFIDSAPQAAGVIPVIIHNNWVQGLTAKLNRMLDWGLESADSLNVRMLVKTKQQQIFEFQLYPPCYSNISIDVMLASAAAYTAALSSSSLL